MRVNIFISNNIQRSFWNREKFQKYRTNSAVVISGVCSSNQCLYEFLCFLLQPLVGMYQEHFDSLKNLAGHGKWHIVYFSKCFQSIVYDLFVSFVDAKINAGVDIQQKGFNSNYLNNARYFVKSCDTALWLAQPWDNQRNQIDISSL